MKKITAVNAWTNRLFIDAIVDYEGNKYTWQGSLTNQKLKTFVVCDADGPIEDQELINQVGEYVINKLEGKQKKKLQESFKSIDYFS